MEERRCCDFCFEISSLNLGKIIERTANLRPYMINGCFQDFVAWKTCDQPVPIEEQACNIPNVCKLFSRELRKQRYLYTCKQCPDTYPWIKNEFGMDFKKKK